MSQYVLCSSSGEEEAGEVTPKAQDIKRRIDLNYILARSLYHKSTYIGRNSKLTGLKLSFSEQKVEYVKNRLRKKVPFSLVISFLSFLEEPSQKLVFYEDAVQKKSSFILTNTSRSVGKVEKVDHCKSFKDLYSEVFASVAEHANFEEKYSIRLSSDLDRIILIQDSVLNNLNELKTPFTVTRSRSVTKILFHNYVAEELSLEKAIELYGEFCVGQTSLSKELRVFSDNNTVLIVFSTSMFLRADKEYRVYKNVDLPKNCNILVEEEEITIVDGYEEGLKTELGIINGLELDDGEYLLYKQKIYKPDREELEECNSIDYSSVFVS